LSTTRSSDLLREVVRRNRGGEVCGIWAACTANPLVLEACLEESLAHGGPLLVEATCNQVNQLGGYTGQTPAIFRDQLRSLAGKIGFPPERLILGGDHLGPSPWQGMPAPAAMEKACELLAAYAAAGFEKIHLDASMPLGGDPIPLPPDLVAGRAAELCAIAEASTGNIRPVYVIGTEVPTPGGAQEALDHVEVTRVPDLEATIELHREAFQRRGLHDAWQRVIAVVVQPGVEFGHAEVVHFHAPDVGGIVHAIGAYDGLAFEAHSTDYQRASGLRTLVENRFAVLKVGPGLTYALREAIFALDAIEREWIDDQNRAAVRRTLDEAMLRRPGYWRKYYEGTAEEQAFARAYSLSDRSRYYWAQPEVSSAVRRLIANLREQPIPLPLLSQYMPAQHAAIGDRHLANDPAALIKDKVREVAGTYAWACGMKAGK
jgi:D-tagatose-1,6-bisphosphate aldolase subunit GatZ/KbaZ